MDEPFAALDAQTREVMQQELLRIWSSSKKTVIFITHQIDEAVFLADRVVVFSARPATIKADIQVEIARPRKLSVKREPQFDLRRRGLEPDRDGCPGIHEPSGIALSWIRVRYFLSLLSQGTPRSQSFLQTLQSADQHDAGDGKNKNSREEQRRIESLSGQRHEKSQPSVGEKRTLRPPHPSVPARHRDEGR